MPADLPELLTGGAPDRYDAAANAAVGHDGGRRQRRVPAAARGTGGVLAALAAVALAAASTHGHTAAAPLAAAPTQAPARPSPLPPELLATLRALHAQSLSGSAGVVPVAGTRPSAAGARSAVELLLGRNCISAATASLALTTPDGRWVAVEVRGNPPQTPPFVFGLRWTGSGYSYRYPPVPDGCP
ncbi:MAG: hypothetical protein ACR2J0_09215 [Mycobacteriales bacterium]